MFNRLNTGGVNLNTQEIRACLYHSNFFENLFSLNERHPWRGILGTSDPDFRMRDIEIILRALSLRNGVDNYAGSMTSFINVYCKDCQHLNESEVEKITEEWDWFLDLAGTWGKNAFWPSETKFSALLFESVYYATQRLKDEGYDLGGIDESQITAWGKSDEFARFSQEGSTKTANVKGRLSETYEILKSLASRSE
jgi:hypothetical protein